eukprot:1634993-Alexandrium_andersonii.AAC.1
MCNTTSRPYSTASTALSNHQACPGLQARRRQRWQAHPSQRATTRWSFGRSLPTSKHSATRRGCHTSAPPSHLGCAGQTQ